MSDLPSKKAIELAELCATMNVTLQQLLDEATELLALHDRKGLSAKRLRILQRLSRDQIGRTRDVIAHVGLFVCKYSGVLTDDLSARLQTDGSYLNDPPEIDLT